MSLIHQIIEKIALVLVGLSISWLGWYTVIILIATSCLIWLENGKIKKKSKISEKAEILQNINNDNLPSWMLFPDKERVDWLNEILSQLWPQVNTYFIKLLRGSIQTNIRKKYESFRFEVIDLGFNPPQLDSVKVYKNAKFKDSIVIDFDIFYDGKCDIKFSLSGAQMGGIRNFQFSVELRIILKPLLPKLPIIGGLQIFFLNTPEIEFSLEGISGFPGLNYLIRRQIEKKITKLIVFPNKITRSFSKNVDIAELRAIEPEGVLRVHVFEAKDLEKRDVTGKSDPYVVLFVGAQEYKTQIIKRSLNPKWDYWCEFIILDPFTQILNFTLYDDDEFNEDDFLGSGEVDIKSIVKGKKTDQWINLQKIKHGKIHFRFTWFSLTSDVSTLPLIVEETKLLKVEHISTAVLLVFLKSGKNLPMITFKKPDPYATLMVGTKLFKTKTKKLTTDPVWEEGFVFLVRYPESDEFYLNILDKKSHESIGQFSYALKNLMDLPNLEISKFEFPLNKSESKVVLSFQLKIFSNEDSFSDSSDTDSDIFEDSFKTNDLKKQSSSSTDDFNLGRIELTLEYSEPRQKLLVIIHKLSNLPVKDKSFPDSYVKLQLTESSIKHKTKVIEENCNPIFEERFEYLMNFNELYEQKLTITVKTVKKIFFNNNNIIGQVIINLKDMDLNEASRSWFDLLPEQD